MGDRLLKISTRSLLKINFSFIVVFYRDGFHVLKKVFALIKLQLQFMSFIYLLTIFINLTYLH